MENYAEQPKHFNLYYLFKEDKETTLQTIKPIIKWDSILLQKKE